MKRRIAKSIILILLSSFALEAKEPVSFNNLPMGDRTKEALKQGRIYATSVVEDLGKDDNSQKLDFSIAGLHNKECSFALRKLSRYEDYNSYMDFVEKSHYSDKSRRLYLLLSSALLPFKMALDFKLDRVKKPGVYHFEFDKGFLKGLKGTINVSNHKSRCLFYSTAKWQGKHTGISSFVLEFFSKALSKKAMERLFQISSTY